MFILDMNVRPSVPGGQNPQPSLLESFLSWINGMITGRRAGRKAVGNDNSYWQERIQPPQNREARPSNSEDRLVRPSDLGYRE